MSTSVKDLKPAVKLVTRDTGWKTCPRCGGWRPPKGPCIDCRIPFVLPTRRDS